MNLIKKSRTTSFLLTLFLGPLGLLYSSVVGGLILIVIAIASASTIIGPFVCWILAIPIGDHCTLKHNKNIDKFMGLRSAVSQVKPEYSESNQVSDSDLKRNDASQEIDTKKCPACAELIKLEAIKCRFCGESFDPDDVAQQIIKNRKEDSFENRILCSDGNCIGVIGPDGKCKVCRQLYNPDE